MSFVQTTKPSTAGYSQAARALSDAVNAADAVVIGAGAGLSVSAGFTYSGERFFRWFSDFEARYGFHDMYSGGFASFASPEEYWAYWSRMILINRYTDPPFPVYGDLLRLIRGREYFVLTTNVDHCFQKAGFEPSRLFYTQGDYGLFQCSLPCRQKTFENEAIIREMVATQKTMRIPSRLLPVCPHCGRPMVPHLRTDDTFVEDEGWHAAAHRYEDFLNAAHGGRVLFLELGVGWNTPGIIKYPFWRMTARNPNAFYLCVNAESADCPDAIAARSLCIEGDIGELLRRLPRQPAPSLSPA